MPTLLNEHPITNIASNRAVCTSNVTASIQTILLQLIRHILQPHRSHKTASIISKIKQCICDHIERACIMMLVNVVTDLHSEGSL